MDAFLIGAACGREHQLLRIHADSGRLAISQALVLIRPNPDDQSGSQRLNASFAQAAADESKPLFLVAFCVDRKWRPKKVAASFGRGQYFDHLDSEIEEKLKAVIPRTMLLGDELDD